MKITEDQLCELISEFGFYPVKISNYFMNKNEDYYENEYSFLKYNQNYMELSIAPKLTIDEALMEDGRFYGNRPFIEENLRKIDEIVNYIRRELWVEN